MDVGRLKTLINSIKITCNLSEENGEKMVLGEVVGIAGAVTLVLEVSDNAHVAQVVPAGGEKSILYQTHTDQTQ